MQRAHQHLQAVVVTAIGIPLAATIAGLFIALPTHPTLADRVVQAAEALGVGLLVVSLLALVYAILVAPYEQRRLLRNQILTITKKYDQLVDVTQGSLVLSDLSTQREVLPENPQLTVRLNFHLRFRNEADIPIEYSIKELYLNITGTRAQIPTTSSSYRVWPKSNDGYLFSIPLDPALTGGFEATLEYVAWYGPTTAIDRYVQHYTYRIRDTVRVHQPGATNGRFWRQDGGYDKRRNVGEKQLGTKTAAAGDIDIQFFNESGRWKKPPGAIRTKIVIKGGNGGSSIGEDGSIIPGTEGELVVKEIPADQLPETAEIQIGKAGRGGTLGALKAPDSRPGYAVVITHLTSKTAPNPGDAEG
jgi:hypothetical protein